MKFTKEFIKLYETNQTIYSYLQTGYVKNNNKKHSSVIFKDFNIWSKLKTKTAIKKLREPFVVQCLQTRKINMIVKFDYVKMQALLSSKGKKKKKKKKKKKSFWQFYSKW